MNLLALIIIFLAIAIAVAIGYIAWEITSDEPRDGPP
jgi:Flp pilus assembly protein CpaB